VREALGIAPARRETSTPRLNLRAAWGRFNPKSLLIDSLPYPQLQCWSRFGLIKKPPNQSQVGGITLSGKNAFVCLTLVLV